MVQYIANREGGMDKLKGMRFAFVHLDHPYGKEPIPTFKAMSEVRFSVDLYPVPPASMTEQKSIWLQIRRTRPRLRHYVGLGGNELDCCQGGG